MSFKLFPGFNPHSQDIFFGRNGTGGKWCECAWWIIGPVEIDQEGSVSTRFLGINKPASPVGLISAGLIGKYNKKAFSC